LPVPTSSRDVNSRPAIFSLAGLSDMKAIYHNITASKSDNALVRRQLLAEPEQ
jgi:hypothetical protein